MKNINETKNKHVVLKLLAIFVIIITIFIAGAFMNERAVSADTGFDQSYDSGGSSDWGRSSDWGSSSYDYGSSSYGKFTKSKEPILKKIMSFFWTFCHKGVK